MVILQRATLGVRAAAAATFFSGQGQNPDRTASRYLMSGSVFLESETHTASDLYD